MIVAAVGSAIATVVNLVNVPRELARRGDQEDGWTTKNA